jgi:hypothetical protein
VFLPGKLSTQIAIMDQLPEEVGVLFGDVLQMHDDGTPMSTTMLERNGAWLGFQPTAPPQGDVYEDLLGGNFIPSMSTLVRRSAFLAAGPYDEQLVYEDWDMWLRIAEIRRFAFVAGFFAVYRHAEGSLGSRLGDRGLESTIVLLLKHVGRRPDRDIDLGRAIGSIAQQLYLNGYPRARHWLDAAAAIDPTNRSATLRLLARARIPGPWLRPAVRAVGAISRRARGARGAQPAA